MPMQTVSFSLDAQTVKDIARLAREGRKSKSDVVRDMFARYQLEKTMQTIQATAAPKLKALNLETEEDIARYAKQH
jgi:Arc/MetJ-type ribon-helix-helix transcriptional regulator